MDKILRLEEATHIERLLRRSANQAHLPVKMELVKQDFKGKRDKESENKKEQTRQWTRRARERAKEARQQAEARRPHQEQEWVKELCLRQKSYLFFFRVIGMCLSFSRCSQALKRESH